MANAVPSDIGWYGDKSLFCTAEVCHSREKPLETRILGETSTLATGENGLEAQCTGIFPDVTARIVQKC
jgi:hypothetical protein